MTKIEQDIYDLHIDYLVRVSNAALDCRDSKEAYSHSLHAVAAAIIISTPEGRVDIQQRKDKIMNVTVQHLLDMYYTIAKERGIYSAVKDEEFQLLSKAKPVTLTNPGRTNTSLKSH